MNEFTCFNHCNLPDLDPDKRISVSDFFKGRDIFITGGSGFMGKVLLEKLLWSCEDVGNLYVLVRPKKDKGIEQRIKDMLKMPVFDRLKNKDVKLLSKIVPIAGDVMQENLGISEEDRRLLHNCVSIVFHVASSVRFDEPLKKAIILNVRGTREVINLSKEMKNLKVVVYVSTTYSYTMNKVIEERVHAADVDWRDIIKLAEMTEEGHLNALQGKFLGPQPNTYTYTKFLAENVIYAHRNELPVCIFRPSIVSSTVIDPEPGWVDNFNGPHGLFSGVLTGVLRVLYGSPSANCDYIPCDYAINGLILTAWYKGISGSEECITVNSASGDRKKLALGFLAKNLDLILNFTSAKQSLWYPSLVVTENRILYYMMLFTTHLLPAFIIDSILWLKGINFRLIKIHRKIFIANKALTYFVTKEWRILTDNLFSLKSNTNPADKKQFEVDMKTVTNAIGMEATIVGIKKFILREDMSEKALQESKRQLTRLLYADRIVKGIFYMVLFWIAARFVLNRYLYMSGIENA